MCRRLPVSSGPPSASSPLLMMPAAALAAGMPATVQGDLGRQRRGRHPVGSGRPRRRAATLVRRTRTRTTSGTLSLRPPPPARPTIDRPRGPGQAATAAPSTWASGRCARACTATTCASCRATSPWPASRRRSTASSGLRPDSVIAFETAHGLKANGVITYADSLVLRQAVATAHDQRPGRQGHDQLRRHGDRAGRAPAVVAGHRGGQPDHRQALRLRRRPRQLERLGLRLLGRGQLRAARGRPAVLARGFHRARVLTAPRARALDDHLRRLRAHVHGHRRDRLRHRRLRRTRTSPAAAGRAGAPTRPATSPTAAATSSATRPACTARLPARRAPAQGRRRR